MVSVEPDFTVSSVDDLADCHDRLEVGCVARIVDEGNSLGGLFPAVTYRKWDGREWVRLGRDRDAQIETDTIGAGITSVRVGSIAGDSSVRYGVQDVVRSGISTSADGVADVLVRYLPDDFVIAYSALIDLVAGVGVGYSGSGRGTGDENAIHGAGRKTGGLGQVKSGGSESLKLKSSSGSSKSSVLMRHEKASIERSKIDRRLRKLAREIKEWLDELGAGKISLRRCSGKCRKFGESDWLYCARCGSRMEEV